MSLRTQIGLALMALCVGCAEPHRDLGGIDSPSEDTPPRATSPETHSNHPAATRPAAVTHAVCVLVPVGDSGVSGTVHFTKEGPTVRVTGSVHGLKPGKHGFHIHQFGDLSDRQEGKSAGDHFNPHQKPHGNLGDKERHAGDFGNIEADESGTARIAIPNAEVALEGPQGIVGRALVVHAGEDKFTQPAGDAGGRVAFGAVGIAKSPETGAEGKPQ